jgi:hypothetical protein
LAKLAKRMEKTQINKIRGTKGNYNIRHQWNSEDHEGLFWKPII